MEKLLSHIMKYLEYLNNTCNLNVSFHFSEGFIHHIPEQALSVLLKYNFHKNPYCMAVKKIYHHKCISHQQNIIHTCHEEAFCRMCHAGVYEYLYPILKNKIAVGYIAVSGYRKSVEPVDVEEPVLWNEALSEEEIPMELCDTLIPPLVTMLDLLFSQYIKEEVNEYNRIIQFLNEYHNNISLSDLCSHFGRSSSYISHMFKQKSGMTIRAYCNELKLEDARNLLLHTNRPVTDIAFYIGYQDVSYFISLFKKKFGVSPHQFRKSYT